jgi:site-specific DNA-methyltransferase (adenine-specific)
VKEEPKQIIKGEHNTYNTEGRKKPIVREKGDKYDPPLPNSMLEIKSTRGKHSTEKPVALMEWVLKYYSREGDTILDPTMGSGSTGVACKNMNRNFIGIEKDPEIYEVAVNRIEG